MPRASEFKPDVLRAPPDIRVEIYRDIRQIEPAIWNAESEDRHRLMSHEFVTVCQESKVESAGYWHLLFYANHRLAAIATVHRMYVNLDLLTQGIVRQSVHWLKTALPRILRVPMLICGLPISSGQPCFRSLPHARPTDICRALGLVMERIAAETSTSILCVKDIGAEHIGFTDKLLDHCFIRAHSLPTCHLVLRWNSLNDYLSSMRSTYRRQALATLRARHRGRLTFRWQEDFDTDATGVHQLYLQTLNRARHRLETVNQEFFRRIAEQDGLRTRLVIVERESCLLGMALIVSTPEVTTFLFTGLNYQQLEPEWQVYQNLILEIVKEAIRQQTSRLELGQTAYDLKTRLGAVEEPRSLYFRYRKPLGSLVFRRVQGLLFPETQFPRRRVFHCSPDVQF